MAEKPTDSPLSFLLENYISLRDMYRRELLPGKSKIYDSLELLRIIFVLTQLTKFEEGFQKMFEDILDKMKITNFSWHDIVQVEESIKNYFYGILKEKDGSSSVRLRFSKRKSDCPDYPFLNIPEQKLPDLLSNCEESILRLVKAHQTQKESEQDPVKREKHSFQCVICLNEKALIDIFDGGRPFYPTPIQDVEEGAPAFDDTLYGLDGGLAEPEGKSPEPTPVKIWPKEGVESDDLTTTDLMDGKIDPTDPSTENALYEKNEARNNKQLSEVEEQSNKGVDDELENVEDRDDKEEKLPNNRKQENSSLRPEIQDVQRGVSETCNAYRTEFRTALDIRDEELRNLGEQLEALKTGEKLECEENYEEGPSTSHNPGTDEFKEELAKAAVEMNKFWNDNKEKIEFEKSEGELNCVITYYDRSRNDTMYELFADEQEALKWAYENKGLMEESYPFIKVWSEESAELTIADFMTVKIELIHPSTGEVLCERFGIADTAAEIASFPYEPKIYSSLTHSVIGVNNDNVPIVFAKLRIDGVLLPKIYEIEVENDKDAAAIGIPQMHGLMHMCDEKMRKIMQETLNTLKAHGL